MFYRTFSVWSLLSFKKVYFQSNICKSTKSNRSLIDELCEDPDFIRTVSGALGINRFECDRSTKFKLPPHYQTFTCAPYFDRNVSFSKSSENQQKLQKRLSKSTPRDRMDVCRAYASQRMNSHHTHYDECSARVPHYYRGRGKSKILR